ncbi:uncharacterized protein LOC135332964 isoform X2 [Halichondria panicea]|uniref:uncharacterized protein LOC135332964 isoform X2 n=1 Tax=Halichondria panicea TaxID=6063 RepID=UPI00312BAA0B
MRALTVCLWILHLLLSGTTGIPTCTYDGDYVMPSSDEVQLQVDCHSNRSDVYWTVEANSGSGEILIDYQCSNDTQLSYTTLRSTRLKRITLGGKNYKMYEYGNVTHLVSNAVLQENTTLVCHYFGCFKDDDYFYPFDAVSCTFGEEATPIVGLSPTSTTPAPPLSLPTPSTSVSSSAMNAELAIDATAVTKHTFQLLSTPPPSPLATTTFVTPGSSSVHGQPRKGHPSSTTEQTLSGQSVSRFLETPVPYNPANLSSDHPSSTTEQTLSGQSVSKFLETPVPYNPANLSSDILMKVWVAVVCVALAFVIIGGVLILIVIRKYYLRLYREYHYPLKVIPGLNDDHKIDLDFSPVMVLDHPQLSRSPSAYSTFTILDKFGQSPPETPKAVSMTSLQRQYLYDMTNSLELELPGQEFKNTFPRYGSLHFACLDGRDYVQLYPNDASGFSGSDMHSYFSVSQLADQEGITQDELNIEDSSVVNKLNVQENNHINVIDLEFSSNDRDNLSSFCPLAEVAVSLSSIEDHHTDATMHDCETQCTMPDR